jgi:hypothetical protein
MIDLYTISEFKQNSVFIRSQLVKATCFHCPLLPFFTAVEFWPTMQILAFTRYFLTESTMKSISDFLDA